MNSKGGGINSGNFMSWDAFRPSPDEYPAWSEVFSRAQKMMYDFSAGQSSLFSPESQGAESTSDGAPNGGEFASAPNPASFFDPNLWMASPAAQLWANQMQKMWQQGTEFWTSVGAIQQNALTAFNPFVTDQPSTDPLAKDRRFSASDWHEHPAFILLRQTYGLLSEQILQAATNVEGVDDATKARLQFAARSITDAMSPTNIAATNPEVLKRAVETKGESLLKGLQNMLSDLQRGQLTHVDRSAFEMGVNIAATPGKVVHETPLYQLIQYTPTTPKVQAVPLLIFPPWINRFYILDLNPEKSFVKWALDQGISVFMVSWQSADESMIDVVWDDYAAAQVDAIDAVREILNVPSVHCVGYCVAGTTLAATLAMLAAQGEADRVKSVTFFTAQVDFELAGDLKIFVDEGMLAILEQLSAKGFLDGRYMAATFNALRSRDLIWNYVVNNYLLGQDYPAFDLLYWNGDTTNLPAKWHKQYLTDLYHQNRLVRPSALSLCGVPIDLRKIETPAFIQAGREDHIAPLASVWRIMDHLSGPKEFVIAGSGHIAGVVNPPSAQKYQYWTGDSSAASLAAFEETVSETKGSWWPYWLEWLHKQDDNLVPAKAARIPGKGKRKAIEDAPGRYVRSI
jgi:polyhydroxyalkanoate synthase